MNERRLENELQFDSILTFGKFKGYSVIDVSELHPHYILWLNANTKIKISSDVIKACESDLMQPDDVKSLSSWR